MTLTALTLIPLALLGVAVVAALTALDSAHHATSRSALEKALASRSQRTHAHVLAHHDDAPRTLGALELGRVLAGTVVAAALTVLAQLLTGSWALATVLGAALTTAVMLLAVSALPRRAGRSRPTAVLIRWRGLLRVTRALLGAVALSLTGLGSRPSARGGEQGTNGPAAQARRTVGRALENEHLHADERDMIQGVFELGDSRVRELMVPRTDMIAVQADTPAHKAMRLFVRSGFSRVPVTGDHVDDLRGMLYVKDLMRTIHSPWDPRPDRPVSEIIRPARFIPESVAAGDVLRQMQSSNVHIAVVIDEYGGVAGIVTIEDVLEEIVGEISDEHNPSEPEIHELEEGRFRVPARAGVSEVGELFDLEISDDDVDSIGGLLGKVLGRVPIVGSHGDAHGLHLQAEKTSGRRKRLSTLIVSRSTRNDDAAPGADQEEPHDDQR